MLIISLIFIVLIIIVISSISLSSFLFVFPNNKFYCKLPLQAMSMESSQNFVCFLMYVIDTEPNKIINDLMLPIDFCSST